MLALSSKIITAQKIGSRWQPTKLEPDRQFEWRQRSHLQTAWTIFHLKPCLPCVTRTCSLARISTVIKKGGKKSANLNGMRNRAGLLKYKEILWCLLYQLVLLTPPTKTQRSVCAAWDTDQRDAMPSPSSDTSYRHCITLSHIQAHTKWPFVFPIASGEVHHQQSPDTAKKQNNSYASLSKQSCDLCAFKRETPSGRLFFWRRLAGGGGDEEGGLIWLNSNRALRSESE